MAVEQKVSEPVEIPAVKKSLVDYSDESSSSQSDDSAEEFSSKPFGFNLTQPKPEAPEAPQHTNYGQASMLGKRRMGPLGQPTTMKDLIGDLRSQSKPASPVFQE